MKYKGLLIPGIHLSKLRLEVVNEELTCVVNSTSNTEVDCADIINSDCINCIFDMDNILISMDYLIDEGYVTKEEAFAYTLDNK